MRTWLTLLLVLAGAEVARGNGLLIPAEKSIPPLAMLRHEVTIAIEDQAAVTRVEQTFRNHTSQQLEATYIFPVPRGASVNKFSMWVDGRETKGELLPAEQARSPHRWRPRCCRQVLRLMLQCDAVGVAVASFALSVELHE